eukprot:TRINITY_DN5226_c0_g2_i4.p1 TRINITY_DN5226_c0_g2~~TRINITY_DN5226_c0_g2_i4.p1  ORF type:complete len:349 (+),score=46.83 TRINITY_DN5226_c0_g2_i4:471-1517(+)
MKIAVMFWLCLYFVLIVVCSGQRGSLPVTPGPVVERVPDPLRVRIQPPQAVALERVTDFQIAYFSGESPDLCVGTDVDLLVEYGEAISSVEEFNMVQAQIKEILNPETVIVTEGIEIAEQILEVFSNYSVTYMADIVSTAPGCWGVALGTSLSGYFIFERMVKNAIDEFGIRKVSRAFKNMVDESEGLVNEIFNFVGFIGASASGEGVIETFGTDLVQDGRIEFLGCMIDQIMDVILGDSKRTNIAKCVTRRVVPKDDDPVACRCRNFGDQPLGCDVHGGISQTICYVADPVKCGCAVDSVFYPDMKWRYCGGSLKDMSQFLDVYDEFSSITPYQSGGFCNSLNARLD